VTQLLLLLVLVFSAVALMVVLGERFARPLPQERVRQLQRWLLPLVGLMLLLSLASQYW